MSVHAQKTAMRQRVESLRSSLSAAERTSKSNVICERAIRLLEGRRGKRPDGVFTLFSYIPFKAEVNVKPIIAWCWDQGGRVVVPKVIRDRRTMSLHLIRGFDELEPGAWGIPEPAMSAPVVADAADLDAMLVPGIAFDTSLGRLGYGGGYYDSFVRRCRDTAGKEPYKLALAFDVQIVPEVPMEPHDFRVDALVTESRIVRAEG